MPDEFAMRWRRALGKGLSAGLAAALLLGTALPVVATFQDSAESPVLLAPARQLHWWMQADALPPIEQVGEGAGEDVETLDQGAPPAQEQPVSDDAESLDQGAAPPAQSGDVETLDQGAPPATSGGETVTVAATELAATVAPAAIADGATAPAGPVLPPDFGTSPVFAVAGRSGVPPGLESCHVGAVTGRAYVGLECGDRGSVVGHAASFEDFPFVEDFPFGDGSPFDENSPFEGGIFADAPTASVPNQDAEIVAAARSSVPGLFTHEESAPPVVETTGPAVVELAQEARVRKSRVRTRRADAEQATSASDQGQSENRSSAKDNGKSGKAEGKDKSRKHDKQANDGGKKRDGNAKHKKKNDKGKQHGKKKGNGKKKERSRKR